MSSENSPPASLHGLAWIASQETSPASAVLEGSAGEGCALTPDDLPGHLIEMHWFPSAAEAAAFALGIVAVRSNGVVASQGTGDATCGVLVARLFEERPKARTLEEAVPLIEHGGASRRRADVKWAHLRAEAARSGKGRRPAALAITVGSVDEDSARITALHWPAGPGNGSFEVRRSDEGYVVQSKGFPFAEAFGGAFGNVTEEDERLLARFSARIVGGQLEAVMPTEGFTEAMLGLQPLLDALWETFYTREKAHQIEQVRQDPKHMRVVRAMQKGATLFRGYHYITLTRPDGKATNVSGPMLRRLEQARLVRPKAGQENRLINVEYELGDGKPEHRHIGDVRID